MIKCSCIAGIRGHLYAKETHKGPVSIFEKASYCKVSPNSKPRDLYLELFDRSYIWQAPRQQCCWCACQIPKRFDDSKFQTINLEASRLQEILRLGVLSDIETGSRYPYMLLTVATWPTCVPTIHSQCEHITVGLVTLLVNLLWPLCSAAPGRILCLDLWQPQWSALLYHPCHVHYIRMHPHKPANMFSWYGPVPFSMKSIGPVVWTLYTRATALIQGCAVIDLISYSISV